MIPFKHAHFFQRSCGHDEYPFVGLLEVEEGQQLHEETLHLLVHAIDRSLDALRTPFSMVEVKDGPWAQKINQSLIDAKKDNATNHPTVSEFLKLPCWPKLSTDQMAASILKLSSFRVFSTEHPSMYIAFGNSSHPLMELQKPVDEAWYTVSPLGIELLESPCKTNGSTLDQILTQPVWKSSDSRLWSLSYNTSTANRLYDDLNALAVQIFKGEITVAQYDDSIMDLQDKTGIWVQSNRKMNDHNSEFIRFAAIRSLLDSQVERKMLQSVSDINDDEPLIKRAFSLSYNPSIQKIDDLIEHLTREELETVALKSLPHITQEGLGACSVDDLHAVIKGNLFFTNDGYLLMKDHQHGRAVWTNFDITFDDQDGAPVLPCGNELLQGMFVLPDKGISVSNQYEAILMSKIEYEKDQLEATQCSSKQLDNS